MLATNGRVVVIGSRGDVTITPRDIMSRRGSILAFTLWGITGAEDKEIHAAILAGLENGTMRPIVGKEIPSPKPLAPTRKSWSPAPTKNRFGPMTEKFPGTKLMSPPV